MTPSESCCHSPRSRFSVTIESIPRPEKTGGRLTRSHGTNERVRLRPVTLETKCERGSQPRVGVRRTRLRVRQRRRVQDDPHGAAVLARGRERPVEGELARDLHRARVADVDLGERRLAVAVRDRRERRHRPAVDRPAVDHAARLDDRDQPVPAQQQLAAVAAELERAEDLRLAAHRDRVDRVAGDREERVAVGLGEVGLVDARLLVVRRREVASCPPPCRRPAPARRARRPARSAAPSTRASPR